MPKQFTASQIQDKAKELVEKNVVRSLQELIEFVNQHDPEMIPELVDDAYNAREIDQDEMFEYLKAEHNEDLVCLNEDQPEILQYVQLSNDWIARKLTEQGEIVIELLGLDVWCRQCFGQAFYLDPCWEALALAELEKYGLDN